MVPKSETKGLPSSTAAEPPTGVSLEQAFEEGPELWREGLGELHVLGREKNTVSKMLSWKHGPDAQPPRKAISWRKSVKSCRFITN